MLILWGNLGSIKKKKKIYSELFIPNIHFFLCNKTLYCAYIHRVKKIMLKKTCYPLILYTPGYFGEKLNNLVQKRLSKIPEPFKTHTQ